MKKILFVLCIGLMMSCGDSKSNDMCEGIKQTQAIHFENRDELPSDFTGKAFTCKDDKVVLFEFINGSLILEDPFTDGKRNGLNKTWYENGKLMSETEFKNDFRDGFERYWFDNGQ